MNLWYTGTFCVYYTHKVGGLILCPPLVSIVLSVSIAKGWIKARSVLFRGTKVEGRGERGGGGLLVRPFTNCLL